MKLKLIFSLCICTSIFPYYVQDPIDLITSFRFGIMAKYIFAQYKDLGLDTTWGEEIYFEHLMKWNKCNGDPDKHSIDDYVKAFTELMQSIKNNGFLPQKSIIKIGSKTLIDGEHRIAASTLFKKNVCVEKIDHIQEGEIYSSAFFKKNSLEEKYLDAMAIQYTTLKKNTYIVVIFPSIHSSNKKAIIEILEKNGSIIYEKNIKLSKNGTINLIRHLYETDWAEGYWNFDLRGAEQKASACFPSNKGIITTFLYECREFEKVKACKEKIRSLSPAGRDSIHINDTHEQTVLHAQVLYNSNSIHFLNYAKPKYMKNFVQFTSWYKNWLEKNKFEKEWFCIDGSAVMSAYGIRDCADLDFLHHEYEMLLIGTENSHVGSHNHPQDLQYHTTSKDDIIFRPENFFYYKGLKFTSIEELKKMKKNRNEKKDQKDLELIQNFINNSDQKS